MTKRRVKMIFIPPERRSRRFGAFPPLTGWLFAVRRKAKGYQMTGVDVWSDPETTAYICRVGEEGAVADLPPDP